MSGKKGRKCSIAHCNSFQHTHKSLSFFRFPKDPERCKAWIAVSGRPELADKLNVYEDRVCEKHFEPSMFLNDYRNRLQNTAIPVLCLDAPPPPPPRAPRPPNQLKIVGTHLMLKNSFEPPPFKRMKVDNGEDDLLEIMKPPVASERGERKKYCIAPQKTYLDACKEMRETGISFRKAAEKYNVNYVTLRRFCSRLNKSMNGINGMSGMGGMSSMQQQSNQMHPDVTIQPISNQSQQKRSPTSLISPQISSQIASQIHAQIQSQIQSQIKMQLQTPSPPMKAPRPKLPPTPTTMPNQTSPATSITPTNVSNSMAPSAGGYKRPRQIFSVEQEEELAVFVRDASNYYNGMSSKDVRILAFVYGVCNQVDLPVGWRESHQASFDWCLGFIKRNKLTPMMTSSHQFRNTGNMNGAAGKDKVLNDEKPMNDDIPKAELKPSMDYSTLRPLRSGSVLHTPTFKNTSDSYNSDAISIGPLCLIDDNATSTTKHRIPLRSDDSFNSSSKSSSFDSPPEMPSPPVPPRLSNSNHAKTKDLPVSIVENQFVNNDFFSINTSVAAPPIAPIRKSHIEQNKSMDTTPNLINLETNTSFELEDFDPLNQNAKPIPPPKTTLVASSSQSLNRIPLPGLTNPMYPYYTPQHQMQLKKPQNNTHDDDVELLRKYGLDQFSLVDGGSDGGHNNGASGSSQSNGSTRNSSDRNNWTVFD